MSIRNRRHIDEWEDRDPGKTTVNRAALLKQLQEKSSESSEAEAIAIDDNFFEPLPFLKKLSAKYSLGIDITTDRLYYIIARKVRNRIEIKYWGSEDLTVDEADRYRSLEFALKYIKSQHHRSGMSVHVSFFAPDINIRQIVIPKLKPAEIRKAILYKNKTDLPNFNEDVWWDYQILESFRENDKDKLRVLVTAIPGEIVDIHMDLLRKAGLKPDELIPRPFALLSVYQVMVAKKYNDVLIDIGTDTTLICFFVDGKLRHVRNFAVGTNNLKVAIENGVAFSDDGKPVKNADDESPRGDADNLRDRLLKKVESLKSRQNPLLQVLLSEILRSLEFFRGPKEEYPINRIFISGAGLKLEAIVSYLKHRLHYPITILAPRFSEKGDSAENGEFLGALGVQLHSDKSMNVIPKEFSQQERFRNLTLLFVVLLIIEIFAMGYYTFLLNGEKSMLTNRIRGVEAQYRQLNPSERIYNEFIKQLNAIHQEKQRLLAPVKRDARLIEVLKLFSNEVPAEIRLTSLSFTKFMPPKYQRKKDKKSTPPYHYQVNAVGQIKGDLVMGDVILINFLNKLNDMHYFKKIKIVDKRKTPKKQLFEFEIEGYL